MQMPYNQWSQIWNYMQNDAFQKLPTYVKNKASCLWKKKNNES